MLMKLTAELFDFVKLCFNGFKLCFNNFVSIKAQFISNLFQSPSLTCLNAVFNVTWGRGSEKYTHLTP